MAFADSAPDALRTDRGLDFLDGGGEMGERVRAFDWAAHPFGPARHWPPALKVAVSLCLQSRFPTTVYWGPDLRLIYNDAWIPIVAEGHPSVLGAPAPVARADIWHAVEPLFRGVFETGQGIAFSDERMQLERYGTVTEGYWTFSLLPIRDEEGVVRGLIGQANETTARVMAEQSIRAADERLQMALDASGNVGTWEWDLTTDIVVGDERMVRLYGVDPALAHVGAPAAVFAANIHPDDYLSFGALMQAAFARQGDISAQYRLLLPDGEIRWLAVQGRGRDGPEGKPARFSGVTLDITDVKRGEEALRRAKEEREFILALVDRQRMQHDADDVMRITAEAVGQRLEVHRAGFFRVVDDSILEYGPCWIDGTLRLLTGSVQVSIFGAALGDIIRSGRTLHFDGRSDEIRPSDAALQATGARAGVCVPLIRDGGWQAGFYLSQAEPRDWSAAEISLIEEVAQLSWDAVARVQATAALRAMNVSLVGEIAARTAERDRIWEVSRDLLGISDLNGVWLNINPAWTTALGWAVDEIVGQSTRWLHHPDDVERTRAHIERIAAGDENTGFENRYRTKTGGYRTLSWRSTLVGDRIYTTARDVTEERRQQAALLEAEERTRLVLEAMDGVGIWTYDIAADRFYSDASSAALFGFDTAQVADGASMAEVMARVHPDDVAKLRAGMAETHGRPGDGETEYRLLLADGTIRWIMARNHTLVDAEGQPETIMGVGVDVTRQRELEERLRQSMKMEAVGQLTGGLAHDFNNLLTAISGAMEMMQMRLKQGRIADLPRYIGSAQVAAGRAAALTHRLLAFSRRQPLDPRPVDVGRLIGGMEDLIRGTMGPAVHVEVEAGDGLWPTLVDPNQLENALLNLCINARDAMPDGGELTIGTANSRFDERAARERDLAPGDYLELSVADTGVGMSTEVIARAFDPFFTTKPIGQGTGLGLSMIYGFVRQSGGRIGIRSTPGQGTVMTLYLPRHLGALAKEENGDGSGAALYGGSGETVLVVEDEPAVRGFVTDILAELGYTAIEAGDGAEALPVIHSDRRIDLLITDVGLPGMNGREVADAARAARPGLPVLFITGFAESAVFGDRPLDPGSQLVTKPFTMDVLAARIREMVGG